ncbi:MAG: glycosyltransferase family 39 protein [Daejeonella sp.]
MSFFRRNKQEIYLILFFTFLKIALHFTANSNFGFHRDELLYMALGDHLDWGFKEVPPFVAGISWISAHLFGDSVFLTRLLPTLFGSMIVLLTGLCVINLGGKKLAISIACIAVIISPAFLASQYLLQPVVFDQFFWTLTAYFVIRYVRTRNVKYIYFTGIAAGFGMLNKYTMAFFVLALIIGLLVTPQRKLLFQKAWLFSALIAFIIFLPNLIWQINNGFPVVKHMQELRETQLENINPVDFLLQQLLIHASGLFIWLAGLIYYFISRSNKQYRFLGISFLVTLILLIVLKGKVYYGFGAYPILFAGGGIAFYKLLKHVKLPIQIGILAFLFLPALLFIPIAIPILPLPTTLKFFSFTSEKLNMRFPLKWEDQNEHSTTQDYADMMGWDEMAKIVEKAYSTIPVSQRNKTTILASNYGQAGGIDHFGKEYNLPSVVCLNSSYALWSPQEIETENIVYIDDEDPDDIVPYYKTIKKIGEVQNPYAREKGTQVYLLSDPVKDLLPLYQGVRSKTLN